MAFYMEEELWKCPKHPSKRRRSGICPTCLYDRLVILCADCGNVRPCACYAAAMTSSSSSSSSSFSLISSGGGAVDRVSNLIDSEPSFRRSRSVAIPFLRSRFGSARESVDAKPPTAGNSARSSFWSVFRSSKSKKAGEERESDELKRNIFSVDDDFERRMMRSRSVSVQVASNSGYGGAGVSSSSAAAKGRGWHFPSPIKAFRQSKMSNGVHQRSPLYRG